MSDVRCALLSVADKTGLLPFAQFLAARGIKLLSSGGTASMLQEHGVPVETVEQYTGSPEVMGGRVKTLHPRVHGGILSRGPQDSEALVQLGGHLIDLVVVNLYPFERVAANPFSEYADLVENIDIGGPSMLRSAAKNHARVTAVCDPSDYVRVREELKEYGEVRSNVRTELAIKAFAHTAAYDTAISQHLSVRHTGGEVFPFPKTLLLPMERSYVLRYGENPHQKGAFYTDRDALSGSLARAKSLGVGGKDLSFNNLIDADAALDAVREFDAPTVVIVKHTNPCGVATAPTLPEAYARARAADPVSAFGGIVACNREVEAVMARALIDTFLECIVAPFFSEEALEILRTKKNLRLLATGDWLAADHAALHCKRVSGGFVLQTRDNSAQGEVRGGTVVTRRTPSEAQMNDLEFAWSVAKHVKSNAIVLAKDTCTVGIGAGQMSRVVSVEIACAKAGAAAQGAVLASDAFFPFADGLEAAAKAGVQAIAQPGGSLKDAEVIAAAEACGLAMVFTSVRHFRH